VASYQETPNYFMKLQRNELIVQAQQLKVRLNLCCPSSAGTDKPCYPNLRSLARLVAFVVMD
jgi:hypothetical protein